MKRLLNAVPALAVLAAGLAGTLAAAPAAHAQDDLVCVGWNDTKPHTPGPNETISSAGKCNAWHYAGFTPTFPTMPVDPLPPRGPGQDPREKDPRTCKDVDTQIAALRRELFDLAVQASIGEAVVAHDRSVLTDAAAAVTSTQAATRAASTALDAAQVAYERAGLVDYYRDVVMRNGWSVSVPIYPDRAHVKRGTPAGDALARVWDAYTDAGIAESGAAQDLRDATAQYAADTAALDMTHDAISRAEAQLKQAKLDRKACTD